MKKVEAEAFAAFKMPRKLRAGKQGLAFLLKEADLGENRYKNTLWLYAKEGLRQLDTGDEVRDFWWQNDGSLLFTCCEKENTCTDKGTEGTVVYRLPAGGGEREKYVSLNEEVEDLLCLPDGGMLYLARDAKAPLPQGALAEDAGDYELVTELPFWENGTGYTSGRRRRLFVWENGTEISLTDEKTEVEDFLLAPGEEMAFLTAKQVDPVVGRGNVLFALNLFNKELRQLPLPAEEFRVHAFCCVNSRTLLVVGSDMKRHGLNQNGAFYRLDMQSGTYTTLYDGGEYTCWNTVACDVQQGAPTQLTVTAGRVFWVSTHRAGAALFSMGIEKGDVRRETKKRGAVVEVAQWEGVLYFTALRGQNGPELYRFLAGQEKALSSWNTHLAALAQKPKDLSVTTSGTESVDGWILKPAGWREGGKYPAVLEIHGGPKLAYGPVFHHEMQYLASQGFAVLFCNPRGSDGKGDAFADIRGQYGKKDCADVLAFLDKALAVCPWIDPGKVGVSGGSYGGYLVNWLIGHTDRFAAAVSQRGIANWVTMAGLSDIGLWFVPDQAGADPWGKTEDVWENSPLRQANRVKTPTLFLHSEEDFRCPLPEGLQMYAALQKQGVPTRMCIFKGENHELSRSGAPRHRVVRLREMAAWFKEHLR